MSNKADSGTGANANIYRLSSGTQKFGIAATADDGHRYGLIVHEDKLGVYDFTDQASEWTIAPGKYFYGAWTATSSSANNTRLTNSITLPGGTYVVTAKFPVISTESFIAGLSYGGTVYTTGAAGNQCTATWILALTSQQTIYLMSTQSAACTFTYLERGYLKAVKVI